jgi:hypothetical protein
MGKGAASSLSQDVQRGFAYLEIAIWCVIMVPLVLLAASTVGIIHDHIRMQQIPVSALREFSAPALRLKVGMGEGRVEVNTIAMQGVIRSISDRIFADGERSLIGGITDISAAACYWVFRVDQSTGKLTSREREVCERRGILGDSISFSQNLMDYRDGAIGYSISGESDATHFMEYTVLIGGAVAGRLHPIVPAAKDSLIQFVRISLPRQEVSL